jgi:predicted ATPase with chaperone activity
MTVQTETQPIEPETHQIDPELVSSLLTDESFRPAEPTTLEDTGLSETLVESLICKRLAVCGSASGREVAKDICLPFTLVAEILATLRSRKLVTHSGAALFNDFTYLLSEQGVNRTQEMLRDCAYVGPAPVPLAEYVLSVEAQSIVHEAPTRERLAEACRGISVEPTLFQSLGPAINSGGAMFLYGAPGNGKSTLARHITACFGQRIWVPHAIIDSGQLIKLYDTQFHIPAVETDDTGDTAQRRVAVDRRWVQIGRPTVVVGGELTLDSLELRHHRTSNICEAPLQMKSNCGCLLIDDFGRQRIAPADLLNRWIVPLESQHDFLTLPTGKKIQVPFAQIVIFSTNLDPKDLVDEAFLRRIPYKIHAQDPTDEEFLLLFRLYCEKFGCEYRKEAVNYLLEKHYRSCSRAKRRCHPRDLLSQVRNYCRYNAVPFELLPEYFDIAVRTYFATVSGIKPA